MATKFTIIADISSGPTSAYIQRRIGNDDRLEFYIGAEGNATSLIIVTAFQMLILKAADVLIKAGVAFHFNTSNE